jgi:hypothetical protein
MQAQHGFVRIKYKLIIIFLNVFVASLAMCNLSDTFRWSVGSGGIRLIKMIQQGYRQRWAHGELKRKCFKPLIQLFSHLELHLKRYGYNNV